MTILSTEIAVCPLDGTEYEYVGLLSYGTYGCGLDGLPVALTPMPHRIPRCPTCVFPAWIDKLSDTELARARALVETPVYAAMTREPSYAHLDFVLSELGRSDPVQRADHLLKACWQTSTGSPEYAAYALALGEAAEAASEAFLAVGIENWATFQSFVANVERQAGLFETAAARLDRIARAGPLSEKLNERLSLSRRLIDEKDGRQVDPDRLSRPAGRG